MSTVRPVAGPLTVYVDGTCAMCVRAAELAARHDPARRLRLTDLSRADRRFSRGELLRELHVVDAAGTVFRGFDAIVVIVAGAHGRRRLGWVLGSGPVRRLGGGLYASVARHRRRAG